MFAEKKEQRTTGDEVQRAGLEGRLWRLMTCRVGSRSRVAGKCVPNCSCFELTPALAASGRCSRVDSWCVWSGAPQTSLCLEIIWVLICLTLCDPMDCSPSDCSVHGFSRQEYWRRLPFPSLDLPNPGIEPASLVFPVFAGGREAPIRLKCRF